MSGESRRPRAVRSYDLRAQMTEQHGAERAVQSMSEIDYANVFKRAGHGTSVSRNG
jgi:hypothetical protein